MRNRFERAQQKSESKIKCSYGDKVFCENYGEGMVAMSRLPTVGSARAEKLKVEKKLKGILCRTEFLLIRFAFAGEQMLYNREGYRIGSNGKLDSKKTLSII